MKYLIAFLIIFLPIFTNSVNAYEYELSICAIFRDDGRFLKEWIQFHIDQGVEHFWLYNNLSQDDWYAEINKYIEKGIVEVIDWPYESMNENDWSKIQCDSYMDCVNRSKRRSVWVAFIDTDEFLFNPKKKKLTHVLKDYKHYAGVAVNWVMYGTGNVQNCEGQLLKKCCMRSELTDGVNKVTKTIARPKYITRCENPHYFYYSNKYSVDENYNKNPIWHSVTCSVSKLRLNHYTYRDLEFLFTVKLVRRLKWGNSIDSLITLDEQYSLIYDPILAK